MCVFRVMCHLNPREAIVASYENANPSHYGIYSTSTGGYLHVFFMILHQLDSIHR